MDFEQAQTRVEWSIRKMIRKEIKRALYEPSDGTVSARRFMRVTLKNKQGEEWCGMFYAVEQEGDGDAR